MLSQKAKPEPLGRATIQGQIRVSKSKMTHLGSFLKYGVLAPVLPKMTFDGAQIHIQINA